MQAVILVGGEGTRLRPLTYVTPKPMVPLFGVPVLEHALLRLREAGVDDVILAAGYLPREIEQYFEDGRRLGIKLTYVVEASPLGTAGALKNVAEHIRGPFFVLNGDVLTDLDLRAMTAFHARMGGVGVLHTIRVEDPSAFGCVLSDEDGRIDRFIEKPAPGEAPTNQINAGTYLLAPEILSAIPPGRSVSIERETFPQLLAAGRPLYAFETSDYWLDIGQPQQYLSAHRDVLAERLALSTAAFQGVRRGTFWGRDSAGLPPNIVPPVFLAEDVAIDPTATVGPFAVIGRGCRIGAGATARDAVLWDGVTLAPGARVADAILASNVRVGEGVVIDRGAVIGHGAEVPAGQTLAPQARVTAAVPAPAAKW